MRVSKIFFPDLDLDFLPIPDPGFRGHKSIRSQIRIRNTEKKKIVQEENECEGILVKKAPDFGSGSAPLKKKLCQDENECEYSSGFIPDSGVKEAPDPGSGSAHTEKKIVSRRGINVRGSWWQGKK